MKLRLLKSTIFKWGVLAHFGIYLTISQWSILLPYLIVCIAPTNHVAIEIQRGLCCITARTDVASGTLWRTSIQLPSTGPECGACIDISFKVGIAEKYPIPAQDSTSKYDLQIFRAFLTSNLFPITTSSQEPFLLATSSIISSPARLHKTILRC